MRKALLVLILASPFLFFACVSHNALFEMTLTGVEIPVDAKKQYGKQRVVRFKDDGKTRLSFDDEVIRVVWNLTSYQVEFTLTNKTEHSIKIIWDESVYIDEKGISKRVLHTGVNFINKNSSQTPSVVARGSTFSDLITPVNNIYTTTAMTGWQKTPLFPIYPIHPNTSVTKKAKIRRAKLFIGQTVQVLLSIEIEDTVNEYIFLFKITDAKIESKILYRL